MEGLFDFIDEVEKIADAMLNDCEFTEELGEEFKTELDALDISKEEKIEQLCLKYKEREYLAKAKKEEADKLAADAARITKANARLADYIFFLTGGEKFETTRAKVTFRTAPASVQITDEARIPPQFWKPGKPTISKTDIKTAIQSGATVPGAYLETGKKNGHIS